MDRATIKAIDAAARKESDKPLRAEMLRRIVKDWLIGHGFLKHREDPEGAN